MAQETIQINGRRVSLWSNSKVVLGGSPPFKGASANNVTLENAAMPPGPNNTRSQEHAQRVARQGTRKSDLPTHLVRAFSESMALVPPLRHDVLAHDPRAALALGPRLCSSVPLAPQPASRIN
jgi:hypothetical protein